jgi:TolB protein
VQRDRFLLASMLVSAASLALASPASAQANRLAFTHGGGVLAMTDRAIEVLQSDLGLTDDVAVGGGTPTERLRVTVNRRGARDFTLSVRLQAAADAASDAPLIWSHDYATSEADLRRAAHQAADAILGTLTGRPGAFDSRLLFARRVGPGRKDLYVADYDGDGVTRISDGTGMALLPNFIGGAVWYTTLIDGRMALTRLGRDGGAAVNGSGITMGVAPCGDGMVFTSTRDGNAEIYRSDVDGRRLERLTNDPAIDVSPACGPSGDLAFVSSRNGTPQLFAMNAEGSDARQLTFREEQSQTPVWCPDRSRRLIAFTSVGRRQMHVFTLDLDTSELRQLTADAGSYKDPAFSPDCRLLAFAGDDGIFVSTIDGRRRRRVLRGAAETLRWGRRN